MFAMFLLIPDSPLDSILICQSFITATLARPDESDLIFEHWSCARVWYGLNGRLERSLNANLIEQTVVPE